MAEIILLVSISETTEFLLTSGIPNVELDHTVGGMELHGVNFDSESGDVLLFEFSGEMSLDESSLADSAITDEDELIFRNLRLVFHLKTKMGE